MRPIQPRLAVFIVLAANDDESLAPDSDVLRQAEDIVELLSASEFLAYADEYADSRKSWELSRAIGAACFN